MNVQEIIIKLQQHTAQQSRLHVLIVMCLLGLLMVNDYELRKF